MSESEWKKGFPEKIGAYECRIDGEEKSLLHKYCELNGRHRWMTLKGGDVIGQEILWREMIRDPSKLK